MKNKQRGFTLIELLLVIVIIMTLGVASTAFYSRFLTQNNVASVQDQLLGSFRKAQTYSMMSKRNGPWGVNYASNKITLFQGSSYATRTTALDETFNVASTITISGFTELTFARITGAPSSTPTITISGTNNTSKQITINSQGVANR